MTGVLRGEAAMGGLANECGGDAMRWVVVASEVRDLSNRPALSKSPLRSSAHVTETAARSHARQG